MSNVLHALIWLVSLIPRAESPLPDSVGPTLPFAMAGGGGMIGRLVRPGANVVQRDQFVRRWSFLGLWLGVGFYGFVVTHQLLLNL